MDILKLMRKQNGATNNNTLQIFYRCCVYPCFASVCIVSLYVNFLAPMDNLILFLKDSAAALTLIYFIYCNHMDMRINP